LRSGADGKPRLPGGDRPDPVDEEGGDCYAGEQIAEQRHQEVPDRIVVVDDLVLRQGHERLPARLLHLDRSSTGLRCPRLVFGHQVDTSMGHRLSLACSALASGHARTPVATSWQSKLTDATGV